METLRQKSKQIFTKALLGDAKKAEIIETSLFDYSDGSADSYRDKAVHLLSNLDPTCIKNTYLRPRVLRGEIKCEDLVSMRSIELFPEHWTQLEKEREAIIDQVFESPKGITTDLFICYKCSRKHKKEIRECTYYTQQTRSADEPETIFVTCTRCNSTWRE